MRGEAPAANAPRSLTPGQIARFQRRLGLRPTGIADADLASAVRGFQRARGLVITGELDEATVAALGAVVTAGLIPEWYRTEIEDVIVGARIGGTDRDTILRFQSAAKLPLTGVVDEATAIQIGD